MSVTLVKEMQKEIDKLLVSAKGNQRENARAKAELLKDIRGA